jgi:cytochrome c556
MRHPIPIKHGAAAAAVLAMLVASLATPAAQQAAPPAPPAPAKPLVPVATNTVSAHPDAYYGEAVTLTASVEQILSKSAFSVDQRRIGQTKGKPAGPTDVLVIAPTLNSPVDLNTYVTVMGEVVKFDPAEIAKKAKDYKLDLSPETIERYRGRPVVMATAVVNEKFVDLAKKPLPPMTADEIALSKVMKQVGPAFAALRTGIDGSNAEAATKNVAVLKQMFAEAEAFWKTKGKADAIQWTQDARKQVDLVEHAVAAGKLDDAKAPAGTLGQSCATCHGAYRERLDDGTYRIKTK